MIVSVVPMSLGLSHGVKMVSVFGKCMESTLGVTLRSVLGPKLC